jgi:transcriptional regulator with XRE-family HTH domain
MTPHALKELRLKWGYTQQQMGQVLGVTQRAWSHYERGERPISKPDFYYLLFLDLALQVFNEIERD